MDRRLVVLGRLTGVASVAIAVDTEYAPASLKELESSDGTFVIILEMVDGSRRAVPVWGGNGGAYGVCATFGEGWT